MIPFEVWHPLAESALAVVGGVIGFLGFVAIIAVATMRTDAA